MHTNQIKKWEFEFGTECTKRNLQTVEQMDDMYLKAKGITRAELTKVFMSGLKINNAQGEGSNVGVALQKDYWDKRRDYRPYFYINRKNQEGGYAIL